MHSQKKNRRDFIKKAAFTSASIVATSGFAACAGKDQRTDGKEFPGSVQKDETLKSKLIVPQNNGLKITGAFLDEISHDIPHQNWGEIFAGIHEVVDACAFQDGHIDYNELDAFFEVNKKLADTYGMKCWTNAESFDRDMPLKFLPIKFDKLRLKLEAAKRANYDKAITFEFSHFMSPQSAYNQAGNLYNRYREYFNL